MPALPISRPPTIVSRARISPPLPAAVVRRRKEACFVVRDHVGQQLAYVYFEDEPGRRSAAKLLSKDEARRIAANMAGRSRCCCAT